MKFLIYLLTFFSTWAYAGEHGGASIKELAWPAFNFTVLFSLIVWKARKPIHNIFTEKSRKVQELFRIAENKFKEAKVRHDEISAKLKNVDHESKRIVQDAHKEIEQMEKRVHEDLQERTQRMWTDSHHLIEAERRQLETELHSEVIEVVVTETREKISANNEYKKKASNKLLESVK